MQRETEIWCAIGHEARTCLAGHGRELGVVHRAKVEVGNMRSRDMLGVS